ncbi:hypothetical protein [Amycolatopsis sp. cmx-11-51]
MSAVGNIITTQRPEFDSRTYGHSKLINAQSSPRAGVVQTSRRSRDDSYA